MTSTYQSGNQAFFGTSGNHSYKRMIAGDRTFQQRFVRAVIIESMWICPTKLDHLVDKRTLPHHSTSQVDRERSQDAVRVYYPLDPEARNQRVNTRVLPAL